MTQDEEHRPQPKPRQLTTIGTMLLVSGIINLFSALSWFITFIGIPLAIYCLVLGMLEIIYAGKILSDPVVATQPAKYIAVMEIVNIISCNFISLAIGIVSLVLYAEPEVVNYFRRRH